MMKPAIGSRSAADGTTVHRYMHVRQDIADVRRGKVRYVHEPHPLKQALLEIYVAVVTAARYNDFDAH